MQQESKTTWLLSELMDVMIPTPRQSPNDWIAALDDGAPALDNGEEEAEHRQLRRLHDGQLVNFQSLTHYCNAALTIRSATDWTVDRPRRYDRGNRGRT